MAIKLPLLRKLKQREAELKANPENTLQVPDKSQARGRQLLAELRADYGLSDPFASRVSADNPSLKVNSSDPFDIGGEATQNAAGVYKGISEPGKTNIEVRPGLHSNSQDVLLHEGLHSAYGAKTPEEQEQYSAMLQRNLPAAQPDVTNPRNRAHTSPRDWIAMRYAEYPNVKVAPGVGQDLRTIDPAALNEVHAELPNYFNMNNMDLPPELAKYYGQYFDTQKASSRLRVANTLADLGTTSFLDDMPNPEVNVNKGRKRKR